MDHLDGFIHEVAARMGEDCAGLMEETLIEIRDRCDLTLEKTRQLIPVILSLVQQVVIKTMDLAMEVEEEEKR